MIDLNTQMMYGDALVFYSLIILMYIDLGITYVVMRMFKDIGRKDWHKQEISWIHRPMMKHFGFKVWGWFTVFFQVILYLGLYYYLVSIGNYEFAMRIYHILFGVYFITLIGNFAIYKQLKSHPKYIKFLNKNQNV